MEGIPDGQWQAIGPLPRQHGMLGVMMREGRRSGAARGHHARIPGSTAGRRPIRTVRLSRRADPGRQRRCLGASSSPPQTAAVGGFTEGDERLLGLFASHAAIALTNARLYERDRELSVLEERARLARELHDAVSQKLFSIRAKARAAEVLVGRDPSRAAPRSRAWPR